MAVHDGRDELSGRAWRVALEPRGDVVEQLVVWRAAGSQHATAIAVEDRALAERGVLLRGHALADEHRVHRGDGRLALGHRGRSALGEIDLLRAKLGVAHGDERA